MKREAPVRELRKLARISGMTFEVVPDRGKGGHWRIHYGDRFTIIKSGELSPTYVRLIRTQLGIE